MTDNRKYVRRGRDPIIHADPGRAEGAARANRKKNGAPYRYADSLIMAPAAVKAMLKIPYRNLQGMATGILGEENAPNYSAIQRRIEELGAGIGEGMVTVTARNGSGLAYITDSTGQSGTTGAGGYAKSGSCVAGLPGLARRLAQTRMGPSQPGLQTAKGDAPVFLEPLDGALSGTKDGADVTVFGDGAYGSGKNTAGCAGRGVTSDPKAGIVSGTGKRDAIREGAGRAAAAWRQARHAVAEATRGRQGKVEKGRRVRKGADSRDRLFCVQAHVWGLSLFQKVGQHGPGGQDQGGRIQQVGRGGPGICRGRWVRSGTCVCELCNTASHMDADRHDPWLFWCKTAL